MRKSELLAVRIAAAIGATFHRNSNCSPLAAARPQVPKSKETSDTNA